MERGPGRLTVFRVCALHCIMEEISESVEILVFFFKLVIHFSIDIKDTNK